ncbi:MAG: hypothetical protein QOK11_1062 [Pseudonocardiales bacterium]|nr:hypothetical protein [Pseudonocardiales bacterium]
MPVDPTPLRALGTRGSDGSVFLRDTGLGYRDGGEEQVLRLITRAKDISSTSDELIQGAVDWAQTYHLHPSRANVVRCLQLPPDARVLEIGAGCGAVTRYLGEVCAAVDALEPMPARAAAARARTRDLDTVEVFVGELSDVPAEAAYDVIVVVGVLEYVGEGTADLAPYLEFLRGIHERLVDGGTLVLAIENQLGAKYLAGAPEDHTDRPFDSIEGYPVGGPARTFSRRQLAALFVETGFAPAFRAAFPDYKLARAVLGELPEVARSLYYRIPQFPSPDWVSQRPPLADERLLWRSLVEAGLETDTPNSFLVLAGKGGPSQVWRDDVAAVFYSTGRRSRFAAQTVVELAGDSVRFVRTPLTDEGPRPNDRFRVVGSVRQFQPGEDLLNHLASHPEADLQALLGRWLAEIDKSHEGIDDPTLDVVPHNLVMAADGEPRVIDVELVGPAAHDQIVRRGVFWMAHHLAPISPAGRWGSAETVRDLAVILGRAAGLDADGAWLEQAIHEELAVQLEVQNGPQLGLEWPAWVKRFEEVLRNDLSKRLADLPLGDRLPDRMRAAQAQAEADRQTAQREIEKLHEHLAAQRAQSEDWKSRYDALASSRVLRIANRCRRGLDAALPAGSRRRTLYQRISGRRG